jgi:hypothetical protein
LEVLEEVLDPYAPLFLIAGNCVHCVTSVRQCDSFVLYVSIKVNKYLYVECKT